MLVRDYYESATVLVLKILGILHYECDTMEIPLIKGITKSHQLFNSAAKYCLDSCHRVFSIGPTRWIRTLMATISGRIRRYDFDGKSRSERKRVEYWNRDILSSRKAPNG